MDFPAPEIYDFIVVGAGPSGCALASGLARSRNRPSVLLVEAGGKNDDRNMRIDAEKWITKLNPRMAWGYQTVPQKHLDQAIINYDRGKGLGGSSSTNFSVWNVGPRHDFDEIASLVGDEAWQWEKAQASIKKLESYYGTAPDVPEGFTEYLHPLPENHGSHGPLKIGFPPVWEKSHKAMTDIFAASGYPLNPDLSSGNPLGISVAPATAYKGVRTTAADILAGVPSNLRILTNTQVAQVIFSASSPTRAIGVKTVDGTEIFAKRETILSTGALDTPKILLLSGIGAAEQLHRFNIPVVLDLPGVGRGLRDHYHINPVWLRAAHTTDRHTYYGSPERQAAARRQWELDQTGPLSELGCLFVVGFFKSDTILSSEEFQALPPERKAHMLQPTVPSYEIGLNGACADHLIDPAHAQPLANIFIFVMNAQSVGQVLLQSADPTVPALFDPQMFSHPYDRRVAVEATREVMKVTRSDAFMKDTVRMLSGPQSTNEEDILAYWRQTATSTWHMTGTVKMGKEGSGEAEGVCVDKNFRVLGTTGLRVVDMSVVPILPNNHTQTTAYCVGQIAAEKLVAEYGLDGDDNNNT